MKKTKEAKEDLAFTTLSIKKKTRDKLDNLGFDRHQPYDSIINALIDRKEGIKAETKNDSSEILSGLSKEVHEIHNMIKTGITNEVVIENTHLSLLMWRQYIELRELLESYADKIKDKQDKQSHTILYELNNIINKYVSQMPNSSIPTTEPKKEQVSGEIERLKSRERSATTGLETITKGRR